jgi:hypothetical protein
MSSTVSVPETSARITNCPRFFTVEFKDSDRWVSPPINRGGDTAANLL